MTPIDPEPPPPELSLESCQVCPRRCLVDRTTGADGFCRTDAGLSVSAVALHLGEEPVFTGTTGICNVFFGHCNLRCRFCQNHQISRNENPINDQQCSLTEVYEKISDILATGVYQLGFVSPSHLVPQMLAIIREVRRKGFRPVIVYNSNGYDRVETIRLLEGWVDVFLPDLKYMDGQLAALWSNAPDYPQVASAALLEMYRQKGSILHLDDNGLAERGLIVRHLVLPGAVDNSLSVLRFLAEHLSPKITLSLMCQYTPIQDMMESEPLNRAVRPEEYARVVEEMHRLGFTNGWVQEFSSIDHYTPDFRSESPFGK